MIIYIYNIYLIKLSSRDVLTLTLTQELYSKPPATRAALRSELRTRAHTHRMLAPIL